MLLVVPVVIAFVGACSSKLPPPAQTVTQTVTISAPLPTTTTVATTTPPPSAEGQEVRDGNLAFTVGGALLERGESVYVEVGMSVKNIGDHSATFNEGYQKLIDDQGQEFSVSSMGLCSIGNGPPGMVLDLNPGVKADCMLNFEVPGNIEPSRVVLHESLYSPGVAVTITIANR
jgi:uncharacterized protein DUF4352